ncbi:MAG TPA: OB-fold domain-containing protein [Paenalcaligenes sp.]|nr:OB-fold domain-containing protein [Paenalcaligenes sp.]
MGVDQTALAQPAEMGAEQYYHQLLAEGVFAIQQCTGCEQYVFYPRMLCPHCGHKGLRWQAAKGLGTVYSTTIVRRRPDRGGDYNVALIDLDEGVRMMSRVDGVSPEEVTIGMRVHSQITEGAEGPMVVFTPAKEEK